METTFWFFFKFLEKMLILHTGHSPSILKHITTFYETSAKIELSNFAVLFNEDEILFNR